MKKESYVRMKKNVLKLEVRSFYKFDVTFNIVFKVYRYFEWFYLAIDTKRNEMRYHLIKPLQWKILFIATILTIHLKAQRYYIEAFQIKHEERNLLRSKTYNKTPLACTLSNDEMEQDVDDCLVDRRKIFSAIGNSIIFQNVMFSQENVYGETEIDKSIEDNKSSCENGIIVAGKKSNFIYHQGCIQI